MDNQYKPQLRSVLIQYHKAIVDGDYTRFSYSPMAHFRIISKSRCPKLAATASKAIDAINVARSVNTPEHYNEVLLPILESCIKETHEEQP